MHIGSNKYIIIVAHRRKHIGTTALLEDKRRVGSIFGKMAKGERVCDETEKFGTLDEILKQSTTDK